MSRKHQNQANKYAVTNFADLPMVHIRLGVVYLLAAWSGPSVMFLRHITQAMDRLDTSTLDFFVVDIDSVPAEFWTLTFGHHARTGAGETLWGRDGVVVASMLTYPRADVESVFIEQTGRLLAAI